MNSPSPHDVHAQLQRRQDAFARRRNIGARAPAADSLRVQAPGRAALASVSTRSRFMVTLSPLREEAQVLGFERRGRNLRHGDRLERLLQRFHQLDALAAASRTDVRCLVDGAQRHLFAAAAAGQQANADLHQAAVQLGMRLARRGVQRDLASAAEGHAERRDHNRLRWKT